MSERFIATVKPPKFLEESAFWFIFQGFRLLVHNEAPEARIPRLEDPSVLGVSYDRRQYLGFLDLPTGPIHCFSTEVSEAHTAPEDMAYLSLRSLFSRLDDSMLALAGRAVQIVEWDRTHRFCGRCGIPVQEVPFERAKECPQCGLTSYPGLAPAIIVSIERTGPSGKELLLAHNLRHPSGFYSVLAGFVEPGETLEECVRREVREEVGIEIRNIRYFGSQPWPFPNSLMIAFTSEYASGDIILEEDELDEADWFAAHSLPAVPPPISIARQLIDRFVEKNGNR